MRTGIILIFLRKAFDAFRHSIPLEKTIAIVSQIVLLIGSSHSSQLNLLFREDLENNY